MLLNTLKLKLHIKMSLLFALLMLVISSILILSSYFHLIQVISRVNDVVFGRIVDNTAGCFETDFNKLSGEMQMLGYTPLVESTSHKERLGSLELLKVMIDGNRNLDAAYIGYKNGDLFLLRRLNDLEVYAKYSPPEQAVYMLTVAEEKQGKRQGTHSFYNKDFEVMKTIVDPGYTLNAVERSWYKNALKSDGVAISSPYIFFTNKKPGITLSLKVPDNNNVIGVDYTTDSLVNMVEKFSYSDETRTILFNSRGEILTSNFENRGVDDNKVATIDTIVDPVINDYAKSAKDSASNDIEYYSAGQKWKGRVKGFELQDGKEEYSVLTVTPEETLMVKAAEYKRNLIVAGIIIIILILPVVWLVSILIAKPLVQLSEQLDKVNDFDFTSSIDIKSSVVEVDNLICTSKSMISTIDKFRNIAETITKQRDYSTLLSVILRETTSISNGSGGAIYLLDKDEACLEIAAVYLEGMDKKEQDRLFEEVFKEGCIQRDEFEKYLDEEGAYCFAGADAGCIEQDILIWTKKINVDEISMSVIPLSDSDMHLMGYIVFAHDKGVAVSEDEKGKMTFITALSGFVSAAIEGQVLLEKRKELLQSLIVLVADAIDAKSPYTGKHCQRVPIIARMIIEEACESKDPLYRDYNLTADEWEEIRVASWLHDCGKVITPVDVVDKATKLECIYNRIHEIRMRFELLKSYADVEYWKGMYSGGNEAELASSRDKLKAELDEEFAFVAKTNIGGEFLSDNDIDRLKNIGNRVWFRTIDNTLGLADVEYRRYKEFGTVCEFPIEEKLLDNKREHIIRKQKVDYSDDNAWGFTMEEPEFAFNRGELYNLEIKRGTLTDEERYIINAHMVHTIKMLSTLPFPKNMRNIVEIAGSHHEKMEGGGYPRDLKAKDLSISARAMAIADIFEALTAADRPYKKMKTLSESLTIMKKMADEQHIDKCLFELFVVSGKPQEYARKYLLKEQLDEVNIDELLGENMLL